MRLASRLFVIALGIDVSSEGFAQQPTTGTLVGIVRDQGGAPLAGARVTVVGPLGLHTATTGESGHAELRLLPAGNYRIRVESQGFRPAEMQDVAVVSGQHTRVPIILTTGIVEEVTVLGAAPLVDLKRTDVTTTFKTDELVSTVPVGRRFTDLAYLAPGVVSGLGTGQFNPSIGGSSGLENAYIIDGVNITSAGWGTVGTGGPAETASTSVTTDFLEEVQVKTAGFEAEYGQALGGVINGVVKSGGNDFTGSVRFYFQPAVLEASGEQVVLEGGSTNIDEFQLADFSVQAAGPFVKDRLFWFLAVNPARIGAQVNRDAPASTNPVLALDPGASLTYPYPELQPAAVYEGQDYEQHFFQYTLKVTWQVTPSQRLELTGFGDRSGGDGNLGTDASNPFNLAGDIDNDTFLDVTRTAAGFFEDALRNRLDYGADHQSLRYSGVFGPSWLIEGQVGHRKSSFEARSEVDDYRFTDLRPLIETGVPFVPVGGGGQGYGGDEETLDLAFKVTGILGKHEIKAGYEYWDADFEDHQSGRDADFPFPIDTDGDDIADSTTVIRSTTGVGVDVLGGVPGCAACPSGEIPFYQATSQLNPSGPTTSSEHSIFLQDTWTIGDRWVAKLGVRAVRHSLEGSGDFTLNLTQVGNNVFTTDPTRFEPLSYAFPTEISPRLGLTFDPRADGRTKLYANYARYFERVPQALAAHAFSNDVFVFNFGFRDPDLTVWDGGAITLGGLSPTRIEENTRLPYVDELVAGWQQLLTPNLTFEVRGIYRDQGRVVEDVQYTPIEEVLNFLAGPDSGGNLPFPGFGANPIGAYVVANPGVNTPSGGPFAFAEPEREYRALELVLNKRRANRWQLTASYRYSQLRGNYEGLYRNDNHQPAPHLTTLFDFPDSPLMRGQFLKGPLNTDRPHVLHLFGTRFFDNGFEVGGAVHCLSGILRTSMLSNPVYQLTSESPGSNPVYISFDPGTGLWTRGSTGFFLGDYEPEKRGNLGRTPVTATVDLHFGYTRPFGESALKVALDVFNTFNSQDATSYSDNVDAVAVPAVPNPNYGRVTGYESPRSIRLAMAWAW